MTTSQEILYAMDHSQEVLEIPANARYVGAMYCRKIGFYKKYYCKDGNYYTLTDTLAAYEERRKRLDEEMREARERARTKRHKKRA